ncbi:hypothetical protein, partial [Cetobacterium sp.]|uniref:hypothetical protein n=1 Tax=Cetobacterium sp. TaxID=2071632 RepID=UPI003EE69DB2
ARTFDLRIDQEARIKTMAEKQQAKFTVPAYAVSEGKPGKKRKTVTVQEKAMNKKSLDKQRDKWRELRELKGLKSDSLMALFLQVNLSFCILIIHIFLFIFS